MTTAAALNIADFGLDTLSLAGSLPQKFDAIRGAGFSQVMLSASDLVNHPDGVDTAVRLVKASGLRVTGFHALRDFEGLSGRLHDYKVEVAKSLLEMCRAVGAPLLLVGSSTSAHAGGAPDQLARDLRKLAMLALPMKVRIGYEAQSLGRHVGDFNAAWEVVCQADTPNLGLVIDAFQVLAAKTPLEDIELLDPTRVFLVQLADFMWTGGAADAQRTETANHLRVFPGEGVHTEQLAELVLRLNQIGYRGDFSFEVFNDDYRQMPPATVAHHGRRSAIWLGEDVLQLSTPLPRQLRHARD